MQSGKHRTKRFLIPLSLLLIFIIAGNIDPLYAEIRGMWVTAWDLTSPANIDNLVNYAVQNGLTEIYAQVRYRGDALYKPNRFFSEYPNPEQRSYVLDKLEDKEFDPLAYLLEKVSDKGIDVYAWVTVFVTSQHKLELLHNDHIYFIKPEWVTRDFMGKPMAHNSYEGAFFDPGVPEVQDYLINIFMDIVTNYPVKGLQLDYIRYPDSQFGYAPGAVKSFQESGKDESEFFNWKEEQITRFVRRLFYEIKANNPNTLLTAAVISNQDKGVRQHSQNWKCWLKEGVIDLVYPMAYAFDNSAIEKELTEMKDFKERIVVGLRAWNTGKTEYKVSSIQTKIEMTQKEQFAGYALFSYEGLRSLYKNLKWNKANYSVNKGNTLPHNVIYGYLTDKNDNPTPLYSVELLSITDTKTTQTDPNGFFYFDNLECGDYHLTCEKDGLISSSNMISISDKSGILCTRSDLRLPIEGE